MGLCASNDTFKAKIDDLLDDIEGLKPCIGDILVLGKGIFSQHICQLIVIFAGLQNTVIKVNGSK